jgi:hypothetical protein
VDFRDWAACRRAAMRSSLPYVPSCAEHGMTRVVVKEFGLLSLKAWNSIKDCDSHLDVFRADASLKYASLNDVADSVKSIVAVMINALGLGTCRLVAEMAVFGVRRDLWAMSRAGVPIGVIVVKQPDGRKREAGQTVLDDPSALGELHDLMMQLPSFYGMKQALAFSRRWTSGAFAGCQMAKTTWTRKRKRRKGFRRRSNRRRECQEKMFLARRRARAVQRSTMSRRMPQA